MAGTVLVTGGTGFVGGWCIVELLARGYDVRTTVRRAGSEPSVRAAVARSAAPADRLELVVADLLRDEGWDRAVAGCSAVLHVASPLGSGSASAQELLEAARDGTLRVLRAAMSAGVPRVVMTSAAAAARPPHRSGRVSDETVWTDPDERTFDAYRRSKILAERAAWDLAARLDATKRLTTILPGAVFGPVLPGQPLGSVQILRALLQGRFPGLPRFGFRVIDVRDLAALHVRAMTSPEAAGERFLAAGEFLWLEEIARILREELGDDARRVPVRRMPDGIVRALALVIPRLRMLALDLGRTNELTTAKSERILGFAPRPARETIVDCARSLLTIPKEST